MRKRMGPALGVTIMLMAIAGCASTQQQPPSVRLERTADARYRAGNLRGAQEAYEALLELKPKHTAAYLRLGAIVHRHGNSEQAEQYFKDALRTDPKSTQAIYNLAILSLNEASRRLHDYVALAPAGPARERVSRLLAGLEELEN